MGDHPVIWTNPHYKARNVYFQFGHKADLFENSSFKTLFLNAIRWASEPRQSPESSGPGKR